VSKALQNLAQTFKSDSRLQTILSAPILSDADKKSIIAEIQKSTNVQDKSNTLQHFLETLAENNRLALLDGVAEKFGTLMSAARGEVEMTITSAAPLDQKVVRQLESAVSKSQYVGQGKKLKVVPKVSTVMLSNGWMSRANCAFARSTRRSVAVWWWRSVTARSTSAYRPRWRA